MLPADRHHRIPRLRLPQDFAFRNTSRIASSVCPCSLVPVLLFTSREPQPAKFSTSNRLSFRILGQLIPIREVALGIACRCLSKGLAVKSPCAMAGTFGCGAGLHLLYAVYERLQLPAAAGMPQLSQRLGFDLPDSLPSDLKALPNLFQRML